MADEIMNNNQQPTANLTGDLSRMFEHADDGSMIINMGPQHPSTHGVLRIVLELEGELISKARPIIGYLHTGIEKSCEYQPYKGVIPLVERMDYLSAFNNSLAYVLSVEKLMDVEIPERAAWLRMIFSELQRIASHLVWLGTHCLDLGAMTVFFWCFAQRETVLSIFEEFSGVRMFPAWQQVGGWRQDVPAGLLDKVRAFAAQFPKELDDYEGILTKNPIIMERMQGVGSISADTLISLGINGPMLRGSGVAHDVRKANPYLFYDRVSFDIPTGSQGDVYDRYQVRVMEMRQSTRIIDQCLDVIPEGPVSIDDRKMVPPPRPELDTSMESVIHHFKLWTEGYRPPVGEAYVPVEGPKGEIGYYVVSDGSSRPWRVKTRPPSFMNLQSLAPMLRGHLVADAVAIIGSIDIVLGEIDR